MPPHETTMTQSAPKPPAFNPNAPHHTRPKVRALRGVPVQGQDPQGKPIQLLGLTDARQISEKMVVTSPAAQMLIPLLDGSRGIPEIVTQVGRGLNPEILQGLIAQLDDAGLIEGPTFDALLAKTRADFDASDILPPASTAQFADMLVMQHLGEKATDHDKQTHGPAKMREVMDQWMAEALKSVPKPSFDALPKAVVAPHLDYARGWLNYAHIYGRLRGCDRPDRVIILGTNHFGMCTGVVACDKGYQTPLGVSKVDADALARLREALGDKLLTHRYDHEREHSIELHIPWIQHVFGKNSAGEHPTVLGVLVHDPAVNNGQSYDGAGVALEEFVGALKKTLQSLPGRTLIVSSADLSHVGPAFGDQQPLAGDDAAPTEARNKVFQNDMQLLDMIVKNQPSELIASMAWQQNPTRWCSTGNIVATLLAVEPAQVDLINYAASMDPQGMTMVSSAALAMK
jgi:AmmeMemoRadiSam system protein B